MLLVFEVILVFVKFVYFWLEAIVLSVVPASVRGKDIAGETVLVTGAGSGIGRLLAIRFANLGCRMVLWDINTEGNEETAQMVKKCGATVEAYTVDVTNKDHIYQTAEKMSADIGQVDILVNNAGIVTGKHFLDCPDSMIKKTMDVNVIAHFWTVKAFLPAMMSQNHGHIVTIASSAGLIGTTGLVEYCTSKFAAVGFDESLRFELESLGKDGVHTTVVCPYLIHTGMFQGCQSRFPILMPSLDPDDVADAVIEGVLCNSRLICLPWQIYMILALKCILPVKVLHLACNFMGATTMMNDFRGRQKVD